MQDIPDLVEALRRSPKILSQFVLSIPESKLDVRRGEGFWTIAPSRRVQLSIFTFHE